MGRLSSLTMTDQGFVFDPTTGQSFTVNRTGYTLLAGLRDGRSTLDLTDLLCRDFSVPKTQAQRDVADFQWRLKQFGLVQGDA